MLLRFDWLTGLSLITTLLSLLVTIYVAKIKTKQQIHYAFLGTTGLVLYWSVIRFIQLLVEQENTLLILENIHYIGVCLLPIALLFTGIIFAKTRIGFSRKYLLLFIVPVISIILALTNDQHHLFIVKYSFISTEFIYGPFYIFHEIYSYGCIILGLHFLSYFSIKNSGFFSKQSILLFLGISFPLVVIILSTQKIVAMPVFLENISFSISMLFLPLLYLNFSF